MKLKLGQKLFAIEQNGFGNRVSVEQAVVKCILTKETETKETETIYKTANGTTLAWLEKGKLKLASYVYSTEEEARKNLKPFIELEISRIKRTIGYHDERLKGYEKELKSLRKQKQ